MRSLVLIYPGDLETLTGGYRYDKRLAEELEQLDDDLRCKVLRISLPGDYPFPDQHQLDIADQTFTQLDDDSLVLVDGLAFSTMPCIVEKHAQRLQFIALIHHPLALETGLTEHQSQQLKTLEIQALRSAKRIVTTSQFTADAMADYQVDSRSIAAIPPGTDIGPLASGNDDGTTQLLCVATLTPRKGHNTLLESLSKISHLSWHLHCVGSTQRHPDTYRALIDQCTALGLNDRITFHGEREETELEAHYACADVFVLASYHEGYGMVLTEAIAHGLPIICTRGGAMQDTVPSGSALLTDPGDTLGLSQALEKYMTDETLRNQLRAHAVNARGQLRSWQQAASELSLQLDLLS